MDGTRRRDRPRTRWLDGVIKVLGERGMTIQQAKVCMKDRKKMEESMGDECPPFDEQLDGAISDRPLLVYAGFLRRLCCGERIGGGR